MRDTLYYMLLNIEKLSPVLLLGDAARFFRERYETKGEILSCIPKETPFKNRYNVFEVCSFLSNTEALEDKTPKIILADDTNISYEILSKVKCIIKSSNKAISKLDDAKEALELWKEEDNNMTFVQYCAYNSPELYYYKNKFNMNKYIDLFSSE